MTAAVMAHIKVRARTIMGVWCGAQTLSHICVRAHMCVGARTHMCVVCVCVCARAHNSALAGSTVSAAVRAGVRMQSVCKLCGRARVRA